MGRRDDAAVRAWAADLSGIIPHNWGKAGVRIGFGGVRHVSSGP